MEKYELPVAKKAREAFNKTEDIRKESEWENIVSRMNPEYLKKNDRIEFAGPLYKENIYKLKKLGYIVTEYYSQFHRTIGNFCPSFVDKTIVKW